MTDVGSTKASVIDGRAPRAWVLHSSVLCLAIRSPDASTRASNMRTRALFRDKLFISTPVAQTDAEAVRKVEALWRTVGCRVERMTAEEHDNVFAAVSHLPHLLAFALVAQIAADPDAARKFALAGAGFRDFTRIAASSPDLWSDVCVANRDALGDELRQHRNLLAELQQAIDECDRRSIAKRLLASGRDTCVQLG